MFWLFRNFVTLDAAENLCHYFNKLMTLSNECRYSHEHGNVSVTQREDSNTQQNHLTPTNSDSILQNRVLHSCADKYKLDSLDTSEKWMNSGSSHSTFTNSLCEDIEGRNQEEIVDLKREDSKSNSISMERIPFMETVMTSSLLWNCQNTEHHKKM